MIYVIQMRRLLVLVIPVGIELHSDFESRAVR